MTLALAETNPAASPSALTRAIDQLVGVQRSDGAWEGEVAWNPMLLAQYIFVRVMLRPDAPISPDERDGMIRYFERTRTADGGWGMHPESQTYVFFTALSYVALRLLGVGADAEVTTRARAWLRAQDGGVLSIPSWGRMWLAVMGLFEYDGVSPILPELFILPEKLPFHPNRYYCHTRYIYLALSYLYGRKFRHDLGAITPALRSELFLAPYDTIDWRAHRHDLAASDVHVPPGKILRYAYDLLRAYDAIHVHAVREHALDTCLQRIVYEMRATRYQGISPVNGLLNCLALFAADPHHRDLAPSLAGVEAWRWRDEGGIRYAGARSHAWDTAFALRATLESHRALDERAVTAVRHGCAYLRATQMNRELPGHAAQHRDSIVGGWCFSDGVHRWPVSDCTAEALSAVLAASDARLVPADDLPSPIAMRSAAEFILARQNPDGGFGSYERRRGGGLLEWINPSEMFGDCMTERSYVECTASCVAALARLLATRPALCPMATRDAVARGVARLRGDQHEDGHWPGFWGVYATYGIFHAVEALHTAGASRSDEALERAAQWLESHQHGDGGWGESYRSCLENRSIDGESLAVSTSWAVLALLHVRRVDAPSVVRGVAWLRERQRADGSWPPESWIGVFFGTAMLEYGLYRAYFPTWALARFQHATQSRERGASKFE